MIPCTGTVVKSCPNGIKQLSNSSELGAQNVSPHQKNIKRKNTTPARRVPAWFIYMSWRDAMALQSCCKKRRFLAVQNGFALAADRNLGEKTLGLQEQRDSSKTVDNRKADSFALLKWITGLKCVNSEVKSVDIHPKKGCLNWPYGTLSESP